MTSPTTTTPATAVGSAAGAGVAARPKRATIEDVAAAAQVSVATVSRAMRGLPNVAASTRARVESAAATLGYTPDPAASRLAAGRTRTVTVVIPNLNGWYFSTVVAGAEAVCADAGYDVLVLGVGSRHDLSRLLSESYHLERRTDGLIVVEVPIEPEQAASIIARGVQIASVGNTVQGQPSVRIDNVAVGRLAAEHLLGLGHRRLAMIGGMSEDPMNFPVPVLRQDGFVEVLEAADVEFDPEMIEGGNFGIDGGQEAMAKLLDRDAPPTAVFAMSDEMAFGALMELNQRGLVAGRDVSIIGVDDHEFARVVDLTTIAQPVTDHGAMAGRLLLEQLESVHEPAEPSPAATTTATTATTASTTSTPGAEGPPALRQSVAPIELVVRSTTGPPPSA